MTNTAPSTSTPRGPKSWAVLIASLPERDREALLDGLSENAVAALPWLFDVWAHRGHQMPPAGDWRTWLILGGRGAGKTRAGAEWIRREVEGATPLAPGRRRRICLIGDTIEQAVEVMVRGESGLLACSPPDRRPDYVSTRKTLVWANGAEAAVYSASNPESLRGPQFDAAWADELGKWTQAEDAWAMLQLCLRLGEGPQCVVTTTPRGNGVLERLMTDPSCVRTQAPTEANAAHLAEEFIGEVRRQFEGTADARRELDGEMVLERPGALWTRALIERCRVKEAPVMRRIVAAVDPPSVAGAGADECGIIVFGVGLDGRGYVLADRTTQGEAPAAWARSVVAAFEEFEADRVVAEVNQGGDLVESLLRQAAPRIPYRAVRATRAKLARAEPVSALYEQGRIAHVGGFARLEDQMCGFGDGGGRSPDRVDALVWAATETMLSPPEREPRARAL